MRKYQGITWCFIYYKLYMRKYQGITWCFIYYEIYMRKYQGITGCFIYYKLYIRKGDLHNSLLTDSEQIPCLPGN